MLSPPPATGGPCITVLALDVLIEGFAFVGANIGGTGIYAEWSLGGFGNPGLWGDNLVVRHCYFDDDIDLGIQLEFVWAADIHDNVFERCDAYGIYAAHGGSGIDHCQIHDNFFQNVGTCALFLDESDDNEIFGNRILGNPAGAGNMIDTHGGGNNLVHHNTLSCSKAQYAVTCLDGAADAWIQNWCIDGPSVANP